MGKGVSFAEATRDIEPEPLIAYLEETFEKEGTEKALSACQITRVMDKNLFWTRLNMLIGDVVFSAPSHHLLTALASSHPSGNIYRYNNVLRNPFSGTTYYGVAGGHFVELAFQFMTLAERCPHPALAETSTDFANRMAPWREFEKGEGAEHCGCELGEGLADVFEGGLPAGGRLWAEV
ncbi:hypothetical protein BGZ57DRAFT_861255 [Hyaloscypha finlandica]|nr:hypothetical protein BGZ57DRAFT_861255 [Hyaloscypha finlandica]